MRLENLRILSCEANELKQGADESWEFWSPSGKRTSTGTNNLALFVGLVPLRTWQEACVHANEKCIGSTTPVHILFSVLYSVYSLVSALLCCRCGQPSILQPCRPYSFTKPISIPRFNSMLLRRPCDSRARRLKQRRVNVPNHLGGCRIKKRFLKSKH